MKRHSGIKDSGARFQIVPTTRKISVPTNNNIIGTVGDINSEQLTFQCPKVIDGHDIKGCASHYVTWRNADGEMGHDHLVLIEEDKESLYFAWTVRGETTTKAGLVSFSIHFEDLSESGKPIYHWGTAECKECEILDTVNGVKGAFENIYVDEETLHFADHTPIYDEQLLLQTPGIVPNGRKPIYTNGIHDVAEFASVDVAVPSNRPPVIEVQGGGLVVASDGTPQNVTTYQLTAPVPSVDKDGTVKATSYGMVTSRPLATFDTDGTFSAKNIKEGVTIFGITGTCPSVKTINLTIENQSRDSSLGVEYYCIDGDGISLTIDNVAGFDTKTFTMPRGSEVCIYCDKNIFPTLDVEVVKPGTTRYDSTGTIRYRYIPMPMDKESVNMTVLIG